MADWNSIAQLLGYENEEQMLYDMYHRNQLPLSQIAEKLGSGRATIRRRLELYEIQRRPRGGANNQSNKRVLLHLMDQRYVRSALGNEIAHVVNSHPSTVYKYLRGEKE
jgi:predicted transcriptional regulator with HTH domain